MMLNYEVFNVLSPRPTMYMSSEPGDIKTDIKCRLSHCCHLF